MSLMLVACVVGVAALVWFFLLRGKSDASIPYEYAAAAAAEPAAPEPAADETPKPLVTIFFGSQTGTAEEFSQTVEADADKYGFQARVEDLEDFEPDEFVDEKLVVFMLATYGEGDPTDNAIGFVKWLKDEDGELAPDALSGIKFSCFGLGNTQYEHYNSVGKLVNRRMGELGASRIYRYGEGDDDGSMEDDFEDWKKDLWSTLAKKELGIEVKASDLPAVKPKLDFGLVPMRGANIPNAEDATNGRPRRGSRDATHDVEFSCKPFYQNTPVRVMVNAELRQDTASGSTRHMEFEIEGSGLSYYTADNLSICPENHPEQVSSVAAALGWDLGLVFKLKALPGHAGAKRLFPTPCSVGCALSRYCDLNDQPSRQTCKDLSCYATVPEEQQRLMQLGTDKEEYAAWVAEPRRSLAEVLQMFMSLQLPFGEFIQWCPRLTPREYTISSSHHAHPHRIHATLSVVREPMDDGRVFKGVCTTFLRDVGPGGTARVFVKPSTFRAPADVALPMVLVGPGTGFAPMRALLQDRQLQMEQGLRPGPTHVFFGCQRSDTDFIYRDEVEAWVRARVITQLHTAFSRQQARKIYVQHRMKESGLQLWDLLYTQGGAIFVCGGTRMGGDVHSTLVDIAREVGGMEEDEAKQFVKTMQDGGRYVQELWS